MIIGWRDLRAKCEVCGERADFSVERTYDELPNDRFQHGTREIGYCLKHVPDEVWSSKARLTAEAQRPHGL